ncbi:MAG: hypothetical protein NUV47_04135, partial [Patescibacteria group bacterium]|nr:hypothetical protein [Patescibacteria group bacterium]
QRLWVAVGENADEVATRINTDPLFVANIARFMANGGYDPSTSQKLAREIMGTNYFGIEEAIRHFGVNHSKQQLAYLSEVPFSEEVLKSCKDTHILVAVFPLSILDIRGIVKKQSDQTLFYSQDWYDKQAFAKDKGEVGWQLVRKEPIANSTSKTWNEQQELLSKDEETPTARIMVYTMVGLFLATEERLLEKVYARCVDLGSDGHRVHVGGFDAKGLFIGGWSDDYRHDSIGLSAARK